MTLSPNNFAKDVPAEGGTFTSSPPASGGAFVQDAPAEGGTFAQDRPASGGTLARERLAEGTEIMSGDNTGAGPYGEDEAGFGRIYGQDNFGTINHFVNRPVLPEIDH